MQFMVDTYILEYVESENKYYISFKDSVSNDCRIEISKRIFNEYMESMKSYIKIKNETSRYLEHSKLTEITLFNRSLKKILFVDDLIVEKTTYTLLHNAVKQIKEPHNKRVEMYFFEEMTVKEIAQKENKTERAIRYSIEQGIKEIQNKFKEIKKI